MDENKTETADQTASVANGSNKWLKHLLPVSSTIVLAGFAFYGGMLFAVRNDVARDLAKKESIYLGQVAGKYSEAPNGKLSKDVDFNLFWQVWDKLNTLYVDKEKINDKKLLYGAIKGMAGAAGDPYTVFMDPVIAKEFSDDLAGTFEGIGAEIGIKNEVLTIVAPLPEMPAEKAGVKAGDKILSIDNAPTNGMSVDEAVNKIRGPKDTVVTLMIYHDGDEKPKEVKITRGTIIVKSVRTNLRDDGIMEISITNFNDDTAGLFDKAVALTLEKNPKGIILDLRNNPGGYLDTAIEMASEWIDHDVVVSEKFSDDKKNEYLSRGRARLKGIPTVILVNEGSASASEIVAGALQDKKQAKLVGAKTFGKGSVQTLEKFSDGSSLKVTIAKWLTPNGRSINDEGIMPDYVVEYTREQFDKGDDTQLKKAVELIKSGEAVRFDIKAATSTKETASTTEKNEIKK